MSTKSWSVLTITFATLAALTMFMWPLLLTASNQSALAQSVFIALMPILLVVVLIEFGTGNLDSRRLAILGLLIALNAVIRLLGAGVSGIETAFFLIILGAYVFGSGFGFILGSGSLFVSALLGAGIGPWLPFQMMAAGLVGIGAGVVSRIPTRKPLLLLCAYAVLASFVYGALMTMWTWPFLAGVGTSLSFVPGAPVSENFLNFLRYELFTGGLLWDLGRAITTVALILLTGKTLLVTLGRVANKVSIREPQL